MKKVTKKAAEYKHLIVWSHGTSMEGNITYMSKGETLTDDDIENIKSNVAEEISNVHGIQSQSQSVVIRNIMKMQVIGMDLNDRQLEAAEKYSKDLSIEPVVLCDSCTHVLLIEQVKESGSCKNCGNKKVRSCLALNDDNLETVQGWIAEGKLDSLWLELFKVGET